MAPVRRAAAARDWRSVRHLFGKLAGHDAEALELEGEAAWWLGDLAGCTAARERAYAAREASGDSIGAARLAMLLSDNNLFAGRNAVANGWLRRARRLLAGQPDSLEHGNLALREGERLHGQGAFERASGQFEAAISCARRFADADLEADGLQAMGRVLISMGRPQEGLACLDEAMLAAARGHLGAYTTGKVYCSLMSACEELGETARVREWSEEASRWATEHGVAVFPGLCRVHRAEALCHQGDLRGAEQEAARACEELVPVHRPNAAAAYHALGEIRRRLGDDRGADVAFERAVELGGDALPGLALLRLRQGRLATAAAMLDRALRAQSHNRLGRAKLLPAQVEVLVAAGELDAAAAAVDELAAAARTFASGQLRADALVAAGRVRLAAGEWAEAVDALRGATREYHRAALPYEAAVAGALLARALNGAGDAESADAALRAALGAFEELGAGWDKGAALAARQEMTRRRSALPGALTDREGQVLRLVAAGLTNREIATELALSEKTVARHLSNIFTKAGVSSRAAAVAFAFRAGVVRPG